MRTDAILVLVAGAGGFDGSGFFGPSALGAYRDEFLAKYPDVQMHCLDWNTPISNVASVFGANRVVGLAHSFGGQRLLHLISAAGDVAETIELILCDPVRYSKSDTVDPEGPVSSDSLIQKFDRKPLPLPAQVDACDCFLREGGQGFLSYPQSSPITPDNAACFQNLNVPGASHDSIPRYYQVRAAFWSACERAFGKAAA